MGVEILDKLLIIIGMLCVTSIFLFLVALLIEWVKLKIMEYSYRNREELKKNLTGDILTSFKKQAHWFSNHKDIVAFLNSIDQENYWNFSIVRDRFNELNKE